MLFDRFWSAYPRKVGKDAARKAFERRRFVQADLPMLLAAIQSQAKCAQWREDGGRFVPHPATWLNQGRWQDGQSADGTDESRPGWAIGAGFANRWDAENAGCFERNAGQFRGGRRIEKVVA